MPLLKEEFHTFKDILALPEGERAELIDGHLYMMATPSRIHQRIVSRLSQTISNYIDSHKGECEAYVSPFAVFINGEEDDTNYVEPDISVICDRDKLTDQGCNGAPDWIIEVISPSSERYDLGLKLFKYRNADVREYWAVNPEKKIVNVFTFGQAPEGAMYAFDEYIPVGIYEGFSVRFSDLI